MSLLSQALESMGSTQQEASLKDEPSSQQKVKVYEQKPHTQEREPHPHRCYALRAVLAMPSRHVGSQACPVLSLASHRRTWN